jgi:hypothetical protein
MGDLALAKSGIIFAAMPLLRRIGPFLALLALTSARAESWEYTISVPEGLPATFELPFQVAHAGPVVLDVTWQGARPLWFGVDMPGHPGASRRSGPSPQKIELVAEPDHLAASGNWKLTVKALPARGEVSGRVKVTVPDAPDVVAKREAALHPPPPPPPPPPAWTLPTAAPVGAPAKVARIYTSLETYRASVLSKDPGPPDACQWQTGFLIYAAAVRERAGAGAPPSDVPTLRYFRRLADAIRRVEGLRTAKDLVLAGPVPEEIPARRLWLAQRYEVVRPIERSLDELNELLRRGHAPALEDDTWLPRLNACLTACERYFDERVRLGKDVEAPNAELAEAQWFRIKAAGGVLDSFVAFLNEPAAHP